MRGALALLVPAALLASCGQEADEPAGAAPTAIPENLQQGELPAQPAAEAGIGTPMEERVATLLAQADAHMRAERWRAAIDSYEQLRGWTGDSNAMVLNNLA